MGTTGQPLCLMLFILAIDPLRKMPGHVTDQGLLNPLPLAVTKLRMFLYADDATIFVIPYRELIVIQ
jgi:hypothetical protein